MEYFHFFIGQGWLSPWYLVFYVAGFLPSLLFLSFVRKSSKFGPGEGLAITYSFVTVLLLLISCINGVLMGLALPNYSFMKFPAIIAGVFALIGLYRLFTTRCITKDLFEKRHLFGIHALIIALMLFNLYSLWLFQNRHDGLIG